MIILKSRVKRYWHSDPKTRSPTRFRLGIVNEQSRDRCLTKHYLQYILIGGIKLSLISLIQAMEKFF